MTLAEPHSGFRLTGWHVLAMFVAFFGVMLAVDTVMMIDAYRTFPGEVASNPYADGLAYDSQLDQQRAQTALGWRMSAGLEGKDQIRLTAIDRMGAPITGLHLAAHLERPATEQGRFDITFREIAPGDYQARAGVLIGAWDLRLSATDRQNHRFDAERRLVAP